MKQIFLCTALLFSTAALAQTKVANLIRFPAGAKLEVVTTSAGTVDGGMGSTNISTTVTRALDIENVTDSGALVEHKIKRLQINFDSPMGSEKFDSENPNDQKSEIGKNLDKTMKNKFTYVIDPSGKVLSVRPDEKENKKQTVGQADMIVDMINSMSGGIEGLVIPKPGDATEFHLLPDNPVGKGDTWTRENGGRKTTYTVNEITDNEILLHLNIDNKVDRTQEMMGMQVEFKGTEKGTGTAVIDRKTGLLKKSTIDTKTDGTVGAMGQTQQMNSKITKTMTVKW